MISTRSAILALAATVLLPALVLAIACAGPAAAGPLVELATALETPAGPPATPGKDAKQGNKAEDARPTSYRIEADVSMRSIPVDVRFSGARIIMFGSATRLGAPPVDAGPLDVVAIIQGAPARLTVRKKTSVAGVWLNTRSVDFEQAPRYYAVVSTRPIEGIARKDVLADNGIGFEQIPVSTALGEAAGLRPELIAEFREAAIKLGIANGQYVRNDDGITFVGKSLFRSQIDLPATTPVGPLDVSVFLFRNGEVVARHNTRVTLAREGFENVVYTFAKRQGVLYGFATVLLATLIGLLSSFLVSLRTGR